MKNANVTLSELEESDREQFISDNQWAFKHGAMIEFGERRGGARTNCAPGPYRPNSAIPAGLRRKYLELTPETP